MIENPKEEAIKIRVHPLLVEELRLRKEDIEKKTGYKLNGGIPIVSKIAAIELRQRRLHEKGKIEISVQKRKGEKKNDVIFM